mmetsp:Transcript_27556/g.41931  ORF Transcript_27556/g.41931 Transcript_27556/m.41931 type:complete len:131 (-) Transcript_27556:387-779(-)
MMQSKADQSSLTDCLITTILGLIPGPLRLLLVLMETSIDALRQYYYGLMVQVFHRMLLYVKVMSSSFKRMIPQVVQFNFWQPFSDVFFKQVPLTLKESFAAFPHFFFFRVVQTDITWRLSVCKFLQPLIF